MLVVRGRARQVLREARVTSKRSHAPVVRLSRVDRQRLERGELATAGQALTERIVDVAPSPYAKKVEARSPHEKELLEAAPPHFGKL